MRSVTLRADTRSGLGTGRAWLQTRCVWLYRLGLARRGGALGGADAGDFVFAATASRYLL